VARERVGAGDGGGDLRRKRAGRGRRGGGVMVRHRFQGERARFCDS